MSAEGSSSILEGAISSAECIVCERQGLWGVYLTQMLRDTAIGDTAITVRRCGSLAECWRRLQQRGSSILLLEADRARLQRVFELVCASQRRFPRSRVLVVLPQGDSQQSWWLREAGAVHVVRSTRELAAVVRMVRRHIEQAEPLKMSWLERIYAGLPWSA